MMRASAFLPVLLLALAACGRHTDTPAASAPPRYPDGIVLSDAAPPQGIYPAYQTELCCWVGPSLRFSVPMTARQHRLELAVYQPKAGPLRTADQVVRLIAPNGATLTSRTVRSGTSQTLSFPVPANEVRGGVASVHLELSGSFIPKEIGTGPDIRRLSLILARITVR